MNEILETPLLGIGLSLLTYELGAWIQKKSKFSFLNPFFLAIILTILILVIFKIPLEVYNLGGNYISFFLGPSTVVLAVPLYRQVERLKSNWFPILCGVLCGSLASICCVILCAKFLRLSNELMLSLVPKAITTPMGIEVSKQIGGIPEVTVFAIILTGITGAIVSPLIFKICRVKDKVAIGVGIGTNSHAVGTSRALELGEVEGAMSSLSIGIAGIFTSTLTPLILKIFL